MTSSGTRDFCEQLLDPANGLTVLVDFKSRSAARVGAFVGVRVRRDRAILALVAAVRHLAPRNIAKFCLAFRTEPDIWLGTTQICHGLHSSWC